MIVPKPFHPLAAPGMMAMGLKWMWNPSLPSTSAAPQLDLMNGAGNSGAPPPRPRQSRRANPRDFISTAAPNMKNWQAN